MTQQPPPISVVPVQYSEAVNIFTAYSHRDERLRDSLEAHLSSLKRTGRILVFHDRRIEPGQDWQNVLDQAIFQSDVFLPLLSSDFIASDYCYGVELAAALQLHVAGQSVVIPVVLRPCDWKTLPELSGLQALPRDAKPVTTWPNQDEALLDIVQGVRRVVERLAPKPIPLETVLNWSPTAMVVARLNRLVGGSLPRPRNALIVVAPDQAVLGESFVIGVLATDEVGEAKLGVPVEVEIIGGVFGGDRGIHPGRSTKGGGITRGPLVAKLFVEDSPAIVSVRAPGYPERTVVIYAEPRPDN